MKTIMTLNFLQMYMYHTGLTSSSSSNLNTWRICDVELERRSYVRGMKFISLLSFTN